MAVQKTTKKNQDFELYAGEDKTVNVVAKDGNDNIYDLTSHTIYWAVAYKSTDSAALLSKNTSSGITITNASQGEFQIEIADTDLDAEVFDDRAEDEIKLYHWCKIVNASGQESFGFEGTIYLKNNPLRETP